MYRVCPRNSSLLNVATSFSKESPTRRDKRIRILGGRGRTRGVEQSQETGLGLRLLDPNGSPAHLGIFEGLTFESESLLWSGKGTWHMLKGSDVFTSSK